MGGKGGGLSQTYQDAMASNSTALTQLAEQQGANSQKLFNESNPGFQSAEDFYQALSSGDPYAISRAIAPAAQQVTTATAGAKQNILDTDPAGGEKNLALEQADVSRGTQIGNLGAGAYTNSFNALASLAGQGTGEGIASAGAATSAYSASNQGYGQLQQLRIEAKGNSLGAMSSLGSDAAGLGAAGISAAMSPPAPMNATDPNLATASYGSTGPTGTLAASIPMSSDPTAAITSNSPTTIPQGPDSTDNFSNAFSSAFPGLAWGS